MHPADLSRALPFPSRPARRALAAAAVLAGAAALAGLAALAGALPLPDPGTAWLAAASPHAAVVVQTVAALVGAAGALAALAGALPRRALAVLAAAEVVVLGLVLQGTATLAVLGYLVAMALPAAVVVLLVQVVRRYPVARWTVGVPALALLAGGAVAARAPLVSLVANLGTALVQQAGRLATVLLVLGAGAAWGAVLASALAGSPGAARATRWVVRHRVPITVVAACGPLPYALVRLTWLTPWPLLGGEVLDPATRIWGVTLSGGAWLGVVLTLGLVRPWGAVFPRWVPVLARRPVPVAAAAVPGGLVAAAVTFTAVPMLVLLPDGGLVTALVSAVVFPCWLWGPALALAVWGYVGHRAAVDAREP